MDILLVYANPLGYNMLKNASCRFIELSMRVFRRHLRWSLKTYGFLNVSNFQSKRHKQWTKKHEEIMLMHMELCVSLRRPHVAKDALFQYKALTQQVFISQANLIVSKRIN